MDTLKEFLLFIRSNKKYWLVPVFLAFLTLSYLMYMTTGTVVAPFIYTLF
jgi:hypothetical protein